jgi:hypothetical protein
MITSAMIRSTGMPVTVGGWGHGGRKEARYWAASYLLAQSEPAQRSLLPAEKYFSTWSKRLELLASTGQVH